LVHVVDASNPMMQLQVESVHAVLREIGAQDKPVLVVLNKIDKIDGPSLEMVKERMPDALPISAKKGTNIGLLCERIEEKLAPRMALVTLLLPHGKMAVLNQLHSLGKVVATEYLENGVKVTVNIRNKSIANILQDNTIKLLD
jgi:GTPase